MNELRCPSKLFGVLTDEDVVEMSCQSRWCGKRPGVTVIHRFNKHTGELLETRKFKTPKEVNINGTSRQGASVRSA